MKYFNVWSMTFILLRLFHYCTGRMEKAALTPGIRKNHPQSLGDLVIDRVFLECLWSQVILTGLYAVLFVPSKSCFLSISSSKHQNAMTDVNLSRPCDACGKPIGGGYKHCPKCNIYLCFMCRYTLQSKSNEFPVKCPMCRGKMDW